jgi:hypothetical protein
MARASREAEHQDRADKGGAAPAVGHNLSGHIAAGVRPTEARR